MMPRTAEVKNMRILIVEDDPDLRESIAEGLRLDGYAVDTCGDGDRAYELLFVENYDLAILDLNLPGMDGLDVLARIRCEKQDLKVLILSARSSISDKVRGLDLGANDYLAKPFDFEELEARIRCLLRRVFLQQSTKLRCGALCLDLSLRRASVAGAELPLTKKEFALLEYFMLNSGRIISQEELIDHVWDADANSFSGAVRVHIAGLRKKLRAALGYDPIATRIGEGYLLEDREEGRHA